MVRRGARSTRRRRVHGGGPVGGGGVDQVPELCGGAPSGRDRVDVAVPVGPPDGRERRGEAPPARARFRARLAAGGVQDGRAQRAHARVAAEARRAVRGDFAKAHDAPDRPPRLGVVRGHRGRLARGEGAPAHQARTMRCAVPVLPLRSEPDDAAEQVTQALLHEPLTVEERRPGWALVVTAYDYPGWARLESIEDGTGDLPPSTGAEPLELARAYLGAPYEWGGPPPARI